MSGTDSKPGLSRRGTKPNAGELEERLRDGQDWINDAGHTETRYPWEGADPRIKRGYNLDIDEPTRLKLEWMAEQMPKGSIRKLLYEGIELVIEKRLEQLIRKEQK